MEKNPVERKNEKLSLPTGRELHTPPTFHLLKLPVFIHPRQSLEPLERFQMLVLMAICRMMVTVFQLAHFIVTMTQFGLQRKQDLSQEPLAFHEKLPRHRRHRHTEVIKLQVLWTSESFSEALVQLGKDCYHILTFQILFIQTNLLLDVVMFCSCLCSVNLKNI